MATTTQNDQVKKDLVLAASEDIISLFLAIECGAFSWAKCLCDPAIRQLASTLRDRFNDSELYMFYRKLCGCTIPPAAPPQKPVTPTGNVLPTSEPEIVLTDSPIAASVDCYDELPPDGYYTSESQKEGSNA